MREDFIFFWGGLYSQWYPSWILDEENKTKYNCCEQYMMHKKALLFEDTEIAEQIMNEKSPIEQKSLGRLVKEFDIKKWDAHKFAIVVRGNYLKFTQNKDLQKQLLATDDLEIVEASPMDKVWGIGLHAEDPRAWNRDTWEGQNLLGKAIMSVREMIKKGE